MENAAIIIYKNAEIIKVILFISLFIKEISLNALIQFGATLPFINYKIWTL